MLERDSEKCVRCGAKAWEVHHKLAISRGGSPFDVNNLESLCTACHRKETNHLFAQDVVFERFRRISCLSPDRLAVVLRYLDAQLRLDEEQSLLEV